MGEILGEETDNNNTSDTQPIVENDLDFMANAYDQLREIIHKQIDGTLTDDDRANFIVQDETMDIMIKNEFNENSGILLNRQDPETGFTIEPEEEIKAQILQTANLPDHLDTFRELDQYTRSGEKNRDVIGNLVSRTPALKGFDLDDAVKLAGGGAEEIATRQQFADANPAILMGAAYLLLDGSQDALEESHPDFAAMHERLGTDFADMASLNIFYSVQDSPAYDTWAKGKQSELINAIEQNPTIMSALQSLRAPDNIHSSGDIQTQYALRSTITNEFATVYAKVYDLPTLSEDDVYLAHKSFNDFNAGTSTAYGHAWSTVPGIENDEAIFMVYNPVVDIVRGKGIETSDLDSTRHFLSTLVEEFQHTTDNIYGDKLLNGTLSPDHPAFDHTSLTILNTLDYTDAGIGINFDGYEAQHVERTAKIVASDVTKTLIQHIVQPETAPTPDNSDNTNTQPVPVEEDVSPTFPNASSGFKI
ncbi:MAG: hypothetical protein COB36_07020 [Alphaproteobacteria bacterium]|nr:MAG: hypothetical protein COB36_07020 [Alphaproteobacteria bacterium]